ncbi:hypothetical protein L596_007048 [Steinernema carpocapsae]|uniref:Uncharacterized protein n=1 Tax=Steinernema carpocapsae TaxID=34508 RepID=A0A4U5P811_STECR|nr:hypothetical protein L596_007048 [Steinernema carpocapsae]
MAVPGKRADIHKRKRVGDTSKSASKIELKQNQATSAVRIRRSPKSNETAEGSLSQLKKLLEKFVQLFGKNAEEYESYIANMKKQFLVALNDLSPVPYQHGFIMETYLWLGAFFVAYEFGHFFGPLFFSHIIRMIFGDLFIAFFAFFAVPLAYNLFPLFTQIPLEDQRFETAVVSYIIGCLRGILFSRLTYVGVAPSTFLAPFVIGINAQFVGSKIANNGREQFLLATIGCATMVDFLFALLDHTLDVPYLLLLAVNTGILFVHIQHLLKTLSTTWEPKNMLQWQMAALTATHFAHSFFQYLLSSEDPPV